MLAGVLWSTSGAFVKTSSLPGYSIAMYRALFAGVGLLALAAMLRARIGWHPLMIPMVACFTSMNYLFISSMTNTSAANTVFLQYTAPFWMFLGSVLWLKEPLDRRSAWALAGAMAGIGWLLAGHWDAGAAHKLGIAQGLGSGVAFAGVALLLRRLRDQDPLWLATVNHLSAGVLLGLGIVGAIGLGQMPHDSIWPPPPSGEMFRLAALGWFQMALPYVLFGWGLRQVNPQEAGILTLVEPALAPVWAYLAAGERPTAATIIGGTILVAMLMARSLGARTARSDLSA